MLFFIIIIYCWTQSISPQIMMFLGGIWIPAFQVTALVLSSGLTLESPEELPKPLIHHGFKRTRVVLIATNVENL